MSEAEYFRKVIGAGAKWSLLKLRKHVEDNAAQFPEGWGVIWKRICHVVVLLFLSGSPFVKSSANTFQLFGVDIMLDAGRNPILMEANGYPSLHTSTELDERVKGTMLRDLFGLLQLDRLCSQPACPRLGVFEYLMQREGRSDQDSKEYTVEARLEAYGAGSWLVNGEYTAASRCNGALTFLKADREYLLTITLAEGRRSGARLWWISRVDRYTLKGKEFHYYTCPAEAKRKTKLKCRAASCPNGDPHLRNPEDLPPRKGRSTRAVTRMALIIWMVFACVSSV